MIKTYLFDMGNVLLHFSHDRMCRQMGELCGRSAAEMKQHLMESGRHSDFESGLATPEEFHAWFEQTFHQRVDIQDLAHASSDIFVLNSPIVPVLDELKSRGHRLVLLSNTSVFHYDFIRRNFNVLDRFDDFVLSYEVKAMKPRPEIYEAALKKIHCEPAECFYTDDIVQYVESGRQHGLDAEVFTTVDELTSQLARRGVPLRNVVPA